MSGKFLARASALSLAVILAACGGDDDSTPLVDVDKEQDDSSTPTGGGSDGESGENPGSGNGGNNSGGGEPATQNPAYRIGSLTNIEDPSTLVPGHIQTTSTTPVAGNAVRLQVAVLKENSDELVLGNDNSVTFFSACTSAEWATLEPTTVNLDTGIGYTEYTPDERCVGQDDVILARINDDFTNLAKVTVTNQPATGTIRPTNYKLGSFDDTTGAFNEGVVAVTNPIMTRTSSGANSTDLKVAVVDADNNQRAVDSGLNIEFTSMCLDAKRASIDSTGTIKNGVLQATYTAEGPSGECLGTDTLYALAGADNQLRASAQLTISEDSVVIGSLDPDGSFTPSLAAEKSTLDYNSEEVPTTNIRSVVGTQDSSGVFTQIVGKETYVDFFSTCIDSGLSSIESTGSTTSGELISTYKAQGCVGDDVIFARVAGTDITASTNVNITAKQGRNLTLGYFDSGTFNSGIIGNTRSTPLPLGVQTKLYLSIADTETEERIKGQPLTVEFFSNCDDQDGASPFSTNAASVNMGYIEILYTAQSCGTLTNDIVRAELTGVEGISATAETTIELVDLDANSLTASLPDPNSIAPSWYSTEGREKTSTLKVQLKDNQGNGIPDKVITFALDNPGAASDVAKLDPVDGGKTNAEGFAEVKIQANEGYDNIVFRVIASYSDSSGNVLEVYSAPIAVNSKLPFQEKFSLGTSNFAPDARGTNGVKVPLTLLAADNEGNRIRGNTAINFETNIGSIDPECILDDEGRCTVTWESLNISSTGGAEYAEIRAYTHGTLAPADASGPTPTGEIDTTVRMLMTTATGIMVELDKQVIPPEGGAFCAEAFVDLDSTGASRYSPPVGTTMEFEATNASLIPDSSSSFTLGSSSALLQTPYSFTGCTFVEPDPDSTEPMKLTVTVTPPNGNGVFDRASE